MEYYTYLPSPLGQLLLVSDGDALTGLWMDTQNPVVRGVRRDDAPVFLAVSRWLAGYFQGQPGEIRFPLSPAGTDFQKQVWKILLTIPFGECRTYGEIAKQISPGMSAQAVGGAVGRNPISILIPCHRVVGTNGRLVGYAGGLDKKQWLLRHEEERK